MALVVEDGTVVAGANSYISVADATDYLTQRGYTIWTPLLEGEKEQALVRATDYLATYTWRGNRVSADQLLDWPRSGAVMYGFDVAETVIPLALKNACAELAIRAAAAALMPDIPFDETGRLVTKTVDKIGPIDEERSYATRGPLSIPVLTRRYPQVDHMLAQLVRSASNTVYR